MWLTCISYDYIKCNSLKFLDHDSYIRKRLPSTYIAISLASSSTSVIRRIRNFLTNKDFGKVVLLLVSKTKLLP